MQNFITRAQSNRQHYFLVPMLISERRSVTAARKRASFRIDNFHRTSSERVREATIVVGSVIKQVSNS